MATLRLMPILGVIDPTTPLSFQPLLGKHPFQLPKVLMGNYPSRCLNVRIGKLAARPGFFERRKAAYQAFVEKAGWQRPTGIVKGFGKEDKTVY